MSTSAVLKQAEAAGIKLSLNGDKLALKWPLKPPDSLISAIKADKANIVAILRRRATELASPEPPANASIPPPPPMPSTVQPPPIPPMSQAPLAVSRTLQAALVLAERSHVQFWRDESGVLVTLPPRDYKREVQEAERALMSCQAEIATICKLPERPRGYEDASWVRAVVDSARLGYRNWRS